jgi:hypothetical protein
MKLRIALLLLTSSLLAADLPFEDRFTEASLTLRKLGRGSWKIENGQAICIQNDELYKKAKDHGPMITWDIPTTDSVIEFEYLPDIDVKTMIFTVNRAKGHAFRIIATADTSRVIAFAASHDDKPASAAAPAMKPGEWQKVRVELRGAKATTNVAGKTISLDQPALAGLKANITIGFSFGTLAVRNLCVSP